MLPKLKRRVYLEEQFIAAPRGIQIRITNGSRVSAFNRENKKASPRELVLAVIQLMNENYELKEDRGSY